MSQQNHRLSRRNWIAGAGIGLGSGLLGVMPAAEAQDSKPAAGKIWSNEYWAKKGDVSLYVFRKRVGAPKTGQAPLPVLFLVHGSSVSSRSSFDLTVPGHGEYSLMNVFAHYGFDVWTMNLENYGRSSQTQGNSDVASGVEDLKAGVELVARETGQQKIHMCGESSGALRAGAYAMARPGSGRPAGFRSVHLQGREFADAGRTRQAAGLLSHAQSPPARPQDDPQHRHARQTGHIRSSGDGLSGR